MKRNKGYRLAAVLIALLAMGMNPAGAPVDAQEVTPIVTGGSIAGLLPDKAAGFPSSTPVTEVATGDLEQITGEKAPIYREYRTDDAAFRQYGSVRVELFRTLNQFTAAGLFSYEAGIIDEVERKPIGSGSRWLPNALVFWQSKYFVRVSESQKLTSSKRESITGLASFLSQSIGPAPAKAPLPALLEALPRGDFGPTVSRYFVGPDSFETQLRGGRDMFGFDGQAEAVIGDYNQTGSPLKLAIVEYHTPQFAQSALERLTGYVASLPLDEQDRIIYRREGNYIVEATNVLNREGGEQLVSAVKYPYGVKWLQDPRLPTQDPFRAQKAAEIILSTLGIVALVMLVALISGASFGAIVFAKRRKRLKLLFSDAGGMLRLDIDPIPGTLGIDGRLLKAADDQ